MHRLSVLSPSPSATRGHSLIMSWLATIPSFQNFLESQSGLEIPIYEPSKKEVLRLSKVWPRFDPGLPYPPGTFVVLETHDRYIYGATYEHMNWVPTVCRKDKAF